MQDEEVERKVPQIKALYTYKGNGMEAAKGEVSEHRTSGSYQFSQSTIHLLKFIWQNVCFNFDSWRFNPVA